MTRIVLITGARAPVAQDLARACRSAGYQVHLADCVRSYAARALRPAFAVHRLPPPRLAFGTFREAILRLIETTGAHCIIPTCEEVFWLAEAAARDGYTDRLFSPHLALLKTLHSKAAFPSFAAPLGIPVPDTQIVTEPPQDQPQQAFEDAVFKPEFSRFATHTLIAPTRAQIARLHVSNARRWVVQQRIRGEEICSWAALHRGRVTAFAAYRPRWRHGHAAAFQLESIPAAALHDISVRIGAATTMTGHLSFDAIVDSEGITYPIECNPRAVSGLHLFDADANLARAIVEGVLCRSPPPGVLRHMAPAMALLGIPAALATGRLGDLCADWRRSRDVINREGLPGVTLGCLADGVGFALQALRSQRSPVGATTADIEWDGEPIP